MILAAGKGKRMGSPLPKVLHPAAGRPLLAWVIAAARDVPCDRIVVIVGHGADEVRRSFAAERDLEWVLQEEQRGTGHARRPGRVGGRRARAPAGALGRRAALSRRHRAASARGGGARVGSDGGRRPRVARLAGASRRSAPTDASRAWSRSPTPAPDELALSTVNAGLYALPAPELFGYLRRVRPNNAQNEIYLTEALNLAAADGMTVRCVQLEDPSEAWGVNTPQDLALVESRLRERGVAGS